MVVLTTSELDHCQLLQPPPDLMSQGGGHDLTTNSSDICSFKISDYWVIKILKLFLVVCRSYGYLITQLQMLLMGQQCVT